MWMVKVESHREFWKCHANLLECCKCNLEFSCVPSFVPAGSGIEASRLSLLTDPKVTKYGPTPVSRRTRKFPALSGQIDTDKRAWLPRFTWPCSRLVARHDRQTWFVPV